MNDFRLRYQPHICHLPLPSLAGDELPPPCGACWEQPDRFPDSGPAKRSSLSLPHLTIAFHRRSSPRVTVATNSSGQPHHNSSRACFLTSHRHCSSSSPLRCTSPSSSPLSAIASSFCIASACCHHLSSRLLPLLHPHCWLRPPLLINITTSSSDRFILLHCHRYHHLLLLHRHRLLPSPLGQHHRLHILLYSSAIASSFCIAIAAITTYLGQPGLHHHLLFLRLLPHSASPLLTTTASSPRDCFFLLHRHPLSSSLIATTSSSRDQLSIPRSPFHIAMRD